MPLNRTIRWRPLASGGLEHLRLSDWGHVIKARGNLIGEDAGRQFALSYEINLTPDWTFETAVIQTDSGVMLILSRDRDGAWYQSSTGLPELAGCVDIDLSGSPFTNTLPVRRISDWVIGEPRRLEMAYIDLPDLGVRRDVQIYTRLSDTLFRYESGDGDFAAEIAFDPDGLVLDYPPLFTRS
ncbi:transcriptional regulator [Arsenicitalea aurantiaca]|uniref:Transcriptional regulator n=1 Tax=Arsenicitalea aurantiaca TaxID=1783274 RepID=A0A433XKR0_9HYPH|nr:putative glycolipid-binding domain-containing protein [Arsenicitalea aurantiaca]RUT34643.1 transcriptional regulator [Arsenicitalea aurantiaca]